MHNKIYHSKLNSIVASLMLLLCCVSSQGQTPQLAWSRQLGGANGEHPYAPPESGNAIVRAADGSIYTTGQFAGTSDFDPGSGTFDLTAAGDLDIYISKLDAAGNFLWARRIGGIGEDVGMAITVDNAGNTYITGYFNDLTDFDPGPEIFNLEGAFYDIFLLKLDPVGNFVWAKNMGSDGYDVANAIVLDPPGNLYITGAFDGSVDFDPGPGVYNLQSAGGAGDNDIFIAKLDTAGNLVWAKGFGAPAGLDMGKGITTDASGNVYATGCFTGTVDFDPGAGTTSFTAVLWDDIFVLKLDASGNLGWARQFGGDGTQEYGNAIAVDASGNVYTTGRFGNTVDFDPGPGIYNLSIPNNNGSHIFVSKLNAAGNFVWARQFGTNDPSNTGMNEGFSIKVDALGNVYTAGNFGGIVDFDPGSGIADTFNLYSPIDYDAYISRLDSSGNFSWVLQFGENDYTAEVVKSIDLDAAGNIYTTGFFYGMSDFDPGTGTSYLSSFGYSDCFVVKLATCNTSDTLTTSVCGSFAWNGLLYTESGTYMQHFIASNGCDSTLVLQLTVNTQLPDASVTQNGATLTANTPGLSYQWLACNNGFQVIPGAQAQSYTATVNGSYAVVVSSLDCSDTSDCFAVTTLSINDRSDELAIAVYPNPVSDVVNIRTQRRLSGASICVSDVTGRILVQHDNISGTDFSLSMSPYPAGIYFLSMKEGTKMMHAKLIKDGAKTQR